MSTAAVQLLRSLELRTIDNEQRLTQLEAAIRRQESDTVANFKLIRSAEIRIQELEEELERLKK